MERENERMEENQQEGRETKCTHTERSAAAATATATKSKRPTSILTV